MSRKWKFPQMPNINLHSSLWDMEYYMLKNVYSGGVINLICLFMHSFINFIQCRKITILIIIIIIIIIITIIMIMYVLQAQHEHLGSFHFVNFSEWTYRTKHPNKRKIFRSCTDEKVWCKLFLLIAKKRRHSR